MKVNVPANIVARCHHNWIERWIIKGDVEYLTSSQLPSRSWRWYPSYSGSRGNTSRNVKKNYKRNKKARIATHRSWKLDWKAQNRTNRIMATCDKCLTVHTRMCPQGPWNATSSVDNVELAYFARLSKTMAYIYLITRSFARQVISDGDNWTDDWQTWKFCSRKVQDQGKNEVEKSRMSLIWCTKWGGV